MGSENFLDLYNVFVNEVSGTHLIFISLSCVAIMFFCSIFRMPNQATILILSVWLLFLSPFFTWLLPIALVLVCVFFGWQIVKLFR
jgi:hypothetical protein